MSGLSCAIFPSLIAISRQSTEVLFGRTTRAFLMMVSNCLSMRDVPLLTGDLRIAPVGAASRAVTFLAIRRGRRFILFAERDQCRCADYVIKSSEVIHSIKERFGGTMGGK